MFPISDSSGRVIAFSGRFFKKINESSDLEEAKYINSPDTPLYNKSNVLYGLDKAKSSIRSRDYTIIVEGQMDLILSHQIGFTNTVAVSGTAFTDTTKTNEDKTNNLGLIKRLSSNVIFAFDGDSAGLRAAYRSSMIALSLDMQVKIAFTSAGKDPADTILENSNNWKEVIKNSTDVVHFLLKEICQKTDNREKRRKEIEEKIFPFLVMITSSIKKSNYIKDIYEKTGIAEEAIIKDFRDYEKKQGGKIITENGVTEGTPKLNSRQDNLSKRFFAVLFWGGENEADKEIIKKTEEKFIQSVGSEEFEKMKTLYEPFSENLIYEAEKWYANKENSLEKDIEEIVINLEEEILNNQLYSIFIKIKEKEKSGQKGDIEQELINYQKIVEKIENIKNLRIK
jgi:DNA primase